MNFKITQDSDAPRGLSPLGALIRQWRDKRGRRQLELSLDMGVPQRHISFVESGRSAPSRALLRGLAEALNIPFPRQKVPAARGWFRTGLLGQGVERRRNEDGQPSA